MKSINELSLDELKSLLSFTTGSGTTYFYCNIEIIGLANDEAVIMYNGSKYSTERSLGEKLIEGKLRYDAYALTMQQDKAEELLASKAEEVIKNMFDSRVEIATSTITEIVGGLQDTVNNALENLNASTAAYQEIDEIKTRLKKAVSSFDISKVEAKLQAKVEEVASVKHDMTEAKKAFDEINNALKAMFK